MDKYESNFKKEEGNFKPEVNTPPTFPFYSNTIFNMTENLQTLKEYISLYHWRK